jgi:hypothetical protein
MDANQVAVEWGNLVRFSDWSFKLRIGNLENPRSLTEKTA